MLLANALVSSLLGYCSFFSLTKCLRLKYRSCICNVEPVKHCIVGNDYWWYNCVAGSTDSRGKQDVAQFNAKTGAEEVDEEENEEEEMKAESRGSSRKDGVRVCKLNEQPTNSSAKSYDPNR